MVTEQNKELWHTIFGVGHPLLKKYQRFHKSLPSPPRCRLCSAPFRGLGGLAMRLTKRGPSNRNPRYCSRCDIFIRAHPGGAEVELSMVFADVRGSTKLAEQISPTEYSQRMKLFYAMVTGVFIRTDGFMIDVVGDEVFALYPPGFSGPQHAKLAVQAAQELVSIFARQETDQQILPFGTGVHTGIVYLGTVEGAEEGIADVRALGDNVNTAARLCSMAGPGEALISDSSCKASGLRFESLEQRHVELKGKSERVNVHVIRM